ncbi:hypothetical protein EYF80_054573 [Liparis tanakae]|uniref:Uncharacterized protein n=1 Tax=Liparis tanakae TaxID=230148 RepID=A0A4Z2F2Y8_9TELE|nr:hypothetical protein EYF80_054573 [Liparis tanakae]
MSGGDSSSSSAGGAIALRPTCEDECAAFPISRAAGLRPEHMFHFVVFALNRRASRPRTDSSTLKLKVSGNSRDRLQ